MEWKELEIKGSTKEQRRAVYRCFSHKVLKSLTKEETDLVIKILLEGQKRMRAENQLVKS